MNNDVRLENLKSFTPCHHELTMSEELKEAKNLPDEIFEVQASNIHHILSNSLDHTQVRELNKLAYIPEQILENVYDTIAQKELEKGLQNLKGTKFNIEYDDVPDVRP